MKVSIIGFGQMGHLIKEIAEDRGHEIITIIDPHHPQATHPKFSEAAMEAVDACLCFTQPDVAINNIKDACHWKKPLVMGTTGWVEHMDEVRQMVKDADIGMVFSSNFSIGVNIFFRIIEQASQVINGFEMYDILAHEAHHKKKMDSPSGTAKTIAQIILDNITRKKKVYEEKLDRRIESEELHFSSMRGGYIPGTHSVYFDSDFDTIGLELAKT